MRTDLFTMRVNDNERAMIAAIAKLLQRTQSDAVRLLIREAARNLQAQRDAERDAARPTLSAGVNDATR